MFIDLVQSLRCIEPHDDTWLVAAVTRMEGRHIIDGTLGCPLCHREYPVRDGVGWFVDRAAGDAAAPSAPPARAGEASAIDGDRVVRAAALLGLTEPGGIVLLGGSWADYAPALAAMVRAHFVALDPHDTVPRLTDVSGIRAGDRLPLAAGSLRAVALDAVTATAARLAAAVRALRSGGRLVAPAAQPLPNDVAELARDAADWVAERAVAGSAPVAITSARRR